LVDGFLVAGQEVPEHSGILQVGARVSLLGVDERGELDAVTDKEDGCVVPNHIPIALLSVELDAEASRVAGGIGGALLPADGGKADGYVGSFADLAEEVGGSLQRPLV
jgi:hypothetical protein